MTSHPWILAKTWGSQWCCGWVGLGSSTATSVHLCSVQHANWPFVVCSEVAYSESIKMVLSPAEIQANVAEMALHQWGSSAAGAVVSAFIYAMFAALATFNHMTTSKWLLFCAESAWEMWQSDTGARFWRAFQCSRPCNTYDLHQNVYKSKVLDLIFST